MPVPPCFDYLGFRVKFEIGNFEFSSFVLIFQDYFGYWIPLLFHMNSRITSLILPKKPVGILVGIILSL